MFRERMSVSGYHRVKTVDELLETRIKSDIIGIETANGITVKSASVHMIRRAIERGISIEEITGAIKNPLYIYNEVVDAENRVSQKFVGEKATISINPTNGKIVTVWKTGKAIRKKFKKGDDEL